MSPSLLLSLFMDRSLAYLTSSLFVWGVVVFTMLEFIPVICAQEPASNEVRSSLLFHAPFDSSPNASKAPGDRSIYTAENLQRTNFSPGLNLPTVRLDPQGGKHGGCLNFRDRSDKVVFFKGENVGFRDQQWSGTISLWMRLTPDIDLKPGYCDPIQITDKTWNNASFFIDFDKELPRDFRLGVFAEYAVWNPSDIAWEKLPASERPMVVVKKPPFARDRWTHVAWTYENANAVEPTQPALCQLFVDGHLQGQLRIPVVMKWDVPKAALMVGIEYIGLIDDIAIFDKALSTEAIRWIASGNPLAP